jgi:putative spermidine/putrescine transport system ATP-binding protein
MHTERGRITDVAYAGMITRYLVELEAGGTLQVVRQNLESSSQEELDRQGTDVVVGWLPEHTVAITESETATREGAP